ncbi:uncharacterized protein DS421_17g599890 [Arachis hypogaea]|nr:uncharacterized protein DS421_17g599890 [Arachis hypogaea]
MPYEFTLSELHPAEGQFPFSHLLILVEPMPDNPWGHHVTTAQAAPFDLAVADPFDDSSTWVEQLEADLESDEEPIPEEVGPVIRELFGDHPRV